MVIIRQRFEQQLNDLRTDVIKMGSMVEEELTTALAALEDMDADRARTVFAADTAVNALRFDLEEQCFSLIVTQQPAARDLRAIVSVMNMIVDLERMGDQAKGIAKIVPHLARRPDVPKPPELRQMGALVARMLKQTMDAYARDDAELALQVAKQDDEVDALYSQVFTQIMLQMADANSADLIEAYYELLRAARELERFGDLATNVAERVIYMVTGRFQEINVDRSEVVSAPPSGTAL